MDFNSRFPVPLVHVKPESPANRTLPEKWGSVRIDDSGAVWPSSSVEIEAD